MQKAMTLILVSGCIAQGQQVNLRGKVLDGTGKAVANGIVEIVKLKLKDTTGADGSFAINSLVTAARNPAPSLSGDAAFRSGILELGLARPMPVTIEVFDAEGNLSHRESHAEAAGGIHRYDLRGDIKSNRLSIVRVSYGEESRTFPYLPMSLDRDATASKAAPLPATARLAKTTAVIDSLKVTASGFAAKTIPISSYDTAVTVTIGAGGGKTSPGCNAGSPLKSGTFTETINGGTRRWMLDVPANYDPKKPYRLIFVWHPLGGSGSQVVNGGFNGLKSLANNTAIFATADGLQGSNSETSGTGWWNVNGGDMKLVQVMLDKINAGLCVDQERIFSTGFSFGGMMSYTLPFEFDVFRAIAPCSGKIDVIPYTAKFTNPIPIMAFHGSSDNFVLTSLGKAFFDKYAARNQCGTQTQAVSPAGCLQYQGCAVSSTWCTFNGGHVTWSEEPPAIWKFFSQF